MTEKVSARVKRWMWMLALFAIVIDLYAGSYLTIFQVLVASMVANNAANHAILNGKKFNQVYVFVFLFSIPGWLVYRLYARLT